MSLRVLLVEDEPSHRLALSRTIRGAAHGLEAVGDGNAALAALARNEFDVAICDVHLPHVDGISVMRTSRERFPSVEFLMMTGFAQVDEAVSAIRAGASDYLIKPFDAEALLQRLTRIEERRALRSELEPPADSSAGASAWSAMIARSAEMVRVRETAEKFASSPAPVLITGESGTGKEIIARAIHAASPRSHLPMVSVNFAPDSPRRFSKRSFLATSAARSPARSSAAKGASRRRTAERSSSTRSRRCRSLRRRSSCASSRKGRSSRWAPIARLTSTFV